MSYFTWLPSMLRCSETIEAIEQRYLLGMCVDIGWKDSRIVCSGGDDDGEWMDVGKEK